jgi:pimeloyl-ACP methyl ester carboxylesterase
MNRAIVVLTVLAGSTACGGGGVGDGGDDDGVDVDAPPGSIDAPGSDGTTPPVDAPPTSAGDPGAPGSWMVHTQATVTISLGSAGNVAGSVYSPSMDGATPAAGPFPLVIVSSGFQLARAQYRIFCEHLATHGHVCVTHEYASSGNHQAKAREIGAIIDWALAAASGLSTRVSPQAIGVAGHSLGGKVSINAAILDPRIKAVVGWDPVDALPPFGNDGSMSVTPEMMGNLRVPLALLGELTDASGGVGGMSCAPSADNYQRFFAAACEAPAVLEVTIAMADHMDWIGDRGSCGLACLACSNGQTADTVVHGITKRVTAAWFLRHLRGDTGMDPWLTAGQIGSPTSVRTSPGC